MPKKFKCTFEVSLPSGNDFTSKFSAKSKRVAKQLALDLVNENCGAVPVAARLETDTNVWTLITKRREDMSIMHRHWKREV